MSMRPREPGPREPAAAAPFQLRGNTLVGEASAMMLIRDDAVMLVRDEVPPEERMSALRAYSQVAEGTYVTPRNEFLTPARLEMESAFRRMEADLKRLRDLRGLRLIPDDADLTNVGIDSRHVVIRLVDGSRRTIDIQRYLEAGTADPEMLGHFETIERYLDGVLPPQNRKYPRGRFREGDRGNLDPRAPRAFMPQPSFELGDTAEGHVNMQLADLDGHSKPLFPWKHKLSPGEYLPKEEATRQREAALKVAAGAMAFVDTFSHGLNLEIDQKQRELHEAEESVRRAMQQQQHPENLRDDITKRDGLRDEVSCLQAMHREVNSISFLSLMSAERAKPIGVVRDEAAYDRAVREAYAMTRRQIPSTSTHAEEYAVGTSALVTLRKCCDIEAQIIKQREAARNAADQGEVARPELPEPMSDRLEMVRMFRMMHMQHQGGLETATVRFYDIYFQKGLPAQGWLLFPEMNAGLSDVVRGRLNDYQEEAIGAMIQASGREKMSSVAKKLREKVVNPVTATRKEAVAARFRRDHPAQPQAAAAAPQGSAARADPAPAVLGDGGAAAQAPGQSDEGSAPPRASSPGFEAVAPAADLGEGTLRSRRRRREGH